MLDLKTAFPAPPPGAAPGLGQAAESVVGPGNVIRGDIECIGRLEVRGELYGEIRCERLVIEAGGLVDGVVEAGLVEVHGRFNGSLKAGEVRLGASAEVQGDLVYEVLGIQPGAVLDGRCFPIGSIKA